VISGEESNVKSFNKTGLISGEEFNLKSGEESGL
jgi:hypothetical protein